MPEAECMLTRISLPNKLPADYRDFIYYVRSMIALSEWIDGRVDEMKVGKGRDKEMDHQGRISLHADALRGWKAFDNSVLFHFSTFFLNLALLVFFGSVFLLSC